MLDCLNKNIKLLSLVDAEDGNLINTGDEREKEFSITTIWHFGKSLLKN